MKERKSRGNYFTKSIVAVILLAVAISIFKIAPNYKNTDIKDKTNVIINNNNITDSLKKSAFVDENENIYLAKQDLSNFFDKYIYYDEQYNLIITTYGTKIGVMEVGKSEIEINGDIGKTNAQIIKKEDTYYLPIKELEKVYNIEVEYIKETDIVLIDSLDRAQDKANLTKNASVKYLQKTLSRTIDRAKKDENVVVISENEEWSKVRTPNGKIGYVKTNNLTNKIAIREKFEEEKNNEKVSLVWDYYSEYVSAPNRTGTKFEGVNVVSPTLFTLEKLGKGEIVDKVGEEGQKYIGWAKENGYKIWGLFANESMIETTSEILNDYELRKKTIDGIVKLAVKYGLDGINLDFENMYLKDKDLYTRFVIELYPRIKDYGMVLSIDVTAPDGGETWSLCFDRHNIAQNVDYMIFMAYDQYGTSSTKPGTTAGYDWIKLNLDKFVGKQEEVPKEKLILGIPFYTRLWTETEGQELKSSVIAMKDIENLILTRFTSNATRNWNEETKQNYIEETRGRSTYRMWIEDMDSIKEKIKMAKEYGLAGIAFWRKDQENQTVWSLASEFLNK